MIGMIYSAVTLGPYAGSAGGPVVSSVGSVTWSALCSGSVRLCC